MRHQSSLILTCAALYLGTPVAQAQDATDLRPMWKTGQVSRYRIAQTETTTAQLQGVGEPQQSSIEVRAQVTWHVIEALDGGGGTCQMTVDSMTFHVTAPDGQTHAISADSSDERFASMRQYIAALTGAPVTFSIGTDGAILSVAGYEPIRAAAGAAGENLSDRFFRDLGRDLAVLTGGQAAVKPGMSWTHDNSSDHPLGTLHQKYTDELRGIETVAGIPIAAIDRRGSLTLEIAQDNRPAQAPALDLRTTDASYSGQLFFDLSRHELIGSHAQQTLALEVTLTAGGRDFTRSIREVTTAQVLRIAEQ
jgi:hypothetical protein